MATRDRWKPDGSTTNGCRLHVVFRILDEQPNKQAPILHAFQDGYWQSVKEFQHHKQFLEGMLLKAIISAGGKYELLHYVIFDVEEDELTEIEETKKCGGYEEMFTFIDPTLPLLPKRSCQPNVGYLLSMFEADPDCTEQLDLNWPLWSGANYISRYAPKQLQLQRITLHKRISSRGTFMYILMCEFAEALAHLPVALGFVDKVRARQCGFSSLYSVDHYF